MNSLVSGIVIFSILILSTSTSVFIYAQNSGKDIIGNSYNPSKSTPTKGDSGDVSRLNVIPFAAENIVNTNDDEQIDSNEEDEEDDN